MKEKRLLKWREVRGRLRRVEVSRCTCVSCVTSCLGSMI